MHSSRDYFVDVDGVLLLGEVFSKRYAKQFNIDIQIVDEFFANAMQLCFIGRADLREELTFVIKKWNFPGSVEELIQFWLSGDEVINTQLIELLNELASEGDRVFILTQQEANRAKYIQQLIKPKLNYAGFFSTHMLGRAKKEPDFYKKILEITQSNPKTTLFIDDEQKNIEVAKTQLKNTHLYTNNEDTIASIFKFRGW